MNDAQRMAGTGFLEELLPFHQAQGHQLTAVLSADTEDGEQILLAFGTEGLIFSCNGDTDTVAVRFGPLGSVDDAEDLTADGAWSRFIGKEFFWGWLMLNQQGYADGVLLSFDGVVPEIGLNVVASEFEVLEIRQRAR